MSPFCRSSADCSPSA
ncbi:unnamed protein product [Thlaspi arvense]|uniref:Uncharacterized protein n=1 Tax=Thlaspi arvense TaxID=13288 RepID=A0AAU9SL07_THLAR|nr:unnamed protein product [Thlaspi arvense]